MSETQQGWQDWTKSTKASDLEKVRAEIEQVRKWQRTHLGTDFAASGIDYPHPSQKVRSLYFFEGNGRLTSVGFQFLSNDASSINRPMYWLNEYLDDPTGVSPSVLFSGGVTPPNTLPLYANGRWKADGDGSSVADVNLSAGEGAGFVADVTMGGDVVSLGVTVQTSFGPMFQYVQVRNAVLWIEGGTSDLGMLDGSLYYRTDLDRFRARANGVTENLAYESDIPTSSNVQPFAAKTTTYTTTNADGVITVDATSASFTVTLVTAVGNSGLTQTFKKINAANTVTIDANTTQTIDGVLTIGLSRQWESVTLVSNGANWIITGWY